MTTLPTHYRRLVSPPGRSRGVLWRVVLAMALAVMPSVGAHEDRARVSPAAMNLDPSRVTWTSLHYEVSTWLGTARSEVTLAAAASELGRLRTPSPDGTEPRSAVTAKAGDVWKIQLESSYWGRTETERVWLDAVSGAALQRTSSKADQEKTYRFTDSGVWAVKTELPSGDENDWFVDYPRELVDGEDLPAETAARCPVVSEPGILFYLLSVAPPTDGETVQRCVYAKKGLHLLEIEHLGREKVEVEFDERLADGRQRRRKGATEAVRYAVRTQFLGTTRDDEKGAALRLLGLEGDLEVDVEPSLRVPLQVSGDLPRVGDVTVRLTRAELRANAR